jgi:hypothetical protein
MCAGLLSPVARPSGPPSEPSGLHSALGALSSLLLPAQPPQQQPPQQQLTLDLGRPLAAHLQAGGRWGQAPGGAALPRHGSCTDPGVGVGGGPGADGSPRAPASVGRQGSLTLGLTLGRPGGAFNAYRSASAGVNVLAHERQPNGLLEAAPAQAQQAGARAGPPVHGSSPPVHQQRHQLGTALSADAAVAGGVDRLAHVLPAAAHHDGAECTCHTHGRSAADMCYHEDLPPAKRRAAGPVR